MRSHVLIPLFGSFLLISGATAQSLTEHAAAAAGATIGTAAGKPISNAITKIFGDVDKSAAQAAKKDDGKAPKKDGKAADAADVKKPPLLSPAPLPQASSRPTGSRSARRSVPQYGADPGPISGGGGSVAQPAAEQPVLAAATVAVQPPVKEATLEEFASIKAGTSDKDMVALLGPPSSRVSVPDDDGHLRESCQYWAKGKPIGTIRLDNGQVVSVEVRN